QFVQYALGLVKAGTRKARLILDEGSVGAFNSVVCNMDYGSMSVMRSLADRRMHKIRRMHETRQSHLGIGCGQRLVMGICPLLRAPTSVGAELELWTFPCVGM